MLFSHESSAHTQVDKQTEKLGNILTYVGKSNAVNSLPYALIRNLCEYKGYASKLVGVWLCVPHSGSVSLFPAVWTRCFGLSQHALGECEHCHTHIDASASGCHTPTLQRGKEKGPLSISCLSCMVNSSIVMVPCLSIHTILKFFTACTQRKVSLHLLRF